MKGRIILVSEGMTASEAHQVKWSMQVIAECDSNGIRDKKAKKSNCSATGSEYDTNMIEGGEKL